MIETTLSDLKERWSVMFDILDMCHSHEEKRACLDTIHSLTKAIVFTEDAIINYKKLINLNRGKVGER